MTGTANFFFSLTTKIWPWKWIKTLWSDLKHAVGSKTHQEYWINKIISLLLRIYEKQNPFNTETELGPLMARGLILIVQRQVQSSRSWAQGLHGHLKAQTLFSSMCMLQHKVHKEWLKWNVDQRVWWLINLPASQPYHWSLWIALMHFVCSHGQNHHIGGKFAPETDLALRCLFSAQRKTKQISQKYTSTALSSHLCTMCSAPK